MLAIDFFQPFSQILGHPFSQSESSASTWSVILIAKSLQFFNYKKKYTTRTLKYDDNMKSVCRYLKEHCETIRRVQHWKGRRWENDRGEPQAVFPVTSHQMSSEARKAPAAPLPESHFQPHARSGAAVAAFGSTDVLLGWEQKEFPQSNMEC